MISALTQILFDWGERCFGTEHMWNRPLRALRLAEEAIELAQALEVDKDTMLHLVNIVYSRPSSSDPAQELGGVMVTTCVLCKTLGTSAEDVLLREARRVLNKDTAHFAMRNQEKLDLGLDHAPADLDAPPPQSKIFRRPIEEGEFEE